MPVHGKALTAPFHHNLLLCHWQRLLQSLGGKARQDEAGLVDLGVVVLAQLVLLLGGPLAQGHLDVGVGVLAADHEADLARRVGGDRGVGVLSDSKDLLAVLLELGDERQVQPLVLGCIWGENKGNRLADMRGS